MKRVLTALVAATMLLLVTSPAHAQDATVSKASLQLIRQTPWLTAEQPFDVELSTSGITDASTVDLVVTLYPAVRFRSAFAQTLEGRNLGRGRSLLVAPLSTIATNARGDQSLTFTLPRADTAPTPNTLPALDRGVYPLTFAVRPHGGGSSLATFTTHLVRLPDGDTGVPLDVAWVQPISAPPVASTDPDGVAAQSSRAGVRALVDAMAATPLLPMALDITPETLAGVEVPTKQSLRALLDVRHPVLAAPYVDVDASALVGAGRADDLALQRSTGEELLNAAVGTRGDPRTWSVDQTLTLAALERLRSLGVTRLVLPESTMRPLSGLSRTLANPYALDAGDGTSVEAVSADTGLSAHFRNRGNQVLAAHQLLADLAVIYLDAPSSPHGVVVRPPSSWRPDPAFLAAALPALTSATILKPVTLDNLFIDVPPLSTQSRPTIRALETTSKVNALPADRLASAQNTVTQLAALLDPNGDTAQTARRLLLVSESERLSTSARDRVLAQIDGTFDRVRGNIRLPNGRTFRLAAREGKIPLTVVNGNGFDVRVDVVLSSEKLEFTDAPPGTRSSLVLSNLVLPANASLTRAIRVKARASATFSLLAIVRSPTGQEVDRSRFTIISTAFSGVGILLSIGAALFLAVWWIRHWRTSRRDRRPVALPH